MSDDDEVVIVEPKFEAKVWQDWKGKLFGHAKGVSTVFRGCVLTSDETVKFDTIKRDMPGITSAEIMFNGGYQVLNKVPIAFIFGQENGRWKFPTNVAWHGPAAVLDFISAEGVIEHTVALEDSPYRFFDNVVNASDCKDCKKIRVRVMEGADICSIVFSYMQLRAPKKLSGLAGDMYEDECRKDVTIECSGGETVKVHKLVLQMYSSTCAARFATASWGSRVLQTEDSKGAWDLLVGSLYGSDEAGFGSTFMSEAMRIAYRDGFDAFVERGFGLALKVIDDGSVLSLLALAWPMRSGSEKAQLCVDKSVELFAPNMTGKGPEWLLEYAAFLEANEEFRAYILDFKPTALDKSSRKRGRASACSVRRP